MEIKEVVKEKYGQAALRVQSGGSSCCGAAAAAIDCCDPITSNLYDAAQTGALPEEAVLASLGCGNPTALAALKEGETVLDLGSGGGIDVLLSARRVGETGFAYGVDMTDEMLTLARANVVKTGVSNVEFVKGTIEDVPLLDGAVDVVISNCVINLSVDKPKVLAEMFRVLAPGGRMGISDVVSEDHLSPAERAERGSYVGCIAGALSRQEYLDGLAAVGFVDAEVQYTQAAAEGMHAALVRATKPAEPTGAAS
jgi:arsenite methyltransferase